MDTDQNQVEHVQITNREYLCTQCDMVHRYHDSDGLYHAHEGSHDGERKWITEVIERHPSSARFHTLLQELGELHNRKQADYGKLDDPFANLRDSAGFGVAPWLGAVIRLNDKINRLKSYTINGRLSNEGVEDSLRDISV